MTKRPSPAKTKTKTRTNRLAQGALAPGRVVSLRDDADADGIIGDSPVRVRGGVPGDVGTFRITHTGKNASWASIHELTTPSPDRVEAPCPVVTRCGGCPWQMVSLDAQRAERAKRLHALLDGIVTKDQLRPLVSAPAETGYRTRALMVLRHKAGRLRLGFFRPRSQELIDTEGCVVQHPALNAALSEARTVLDEAEIGTWRGLHRQGLLRALAMRVDPSDGRGILAIIATRATGDFRKLAPALMAIKGVSGVSLVVNDAESGPLGRGEVVHLAGARRQRLRLGGTPLLVGPVTFFQTHHAMAEVLLEQVAAAVPESTPHLVDLYAGVGVFGLALRARAAKVTLIESAPTALSDARANLSRLPDTDHVKLIAGDVAQHVAAALGDDTGATVILDPPRAGAGAAVIQALAASSAQTLIYVSCHPKALARDLRALVDAGFKVDAVTPLEMFPHTPHLEVVATLTRGADT